MGDDDKLDAAYGLQTPDDSRRLYADWADTYDADFVAESQYILHDNVARAFAAAGGRGPVLDIGAGTGLAGIALAREAVQPIDGTDISPEMLEQAEAKNTYRRLFAGDILEGLDVPDGSYPGIISSGTFTLGHVGPEGLDEVVRLLAPRGLAVISVRDAHFETAGFVQKLAMLNPFLANVGQIRARIYGADAQGPHAMDMAILLHLWKS